MHLSKLTKPSAFLQSLKQIASRKSSIPVSEVQFSQKISPTIEYSTPVTECQTQEEYSQGVARTDQGYYVTGLYLQCASWDQRPKILQECLSSQLKMEMPVIQYQVQEKDERQNITYGCPVFEYRDFSQEFGTALGQNLGVIQLETEMDPGHWVMRSVALLLQ